MSMLAAATSTPIHVPRVEWVAILPELILVGAALVLLTASGLRRARLPRGVHMIATIAAAGGALGAAWYLWAQVSDGKARDAVAGAVVVDGFSVFFMILVSCAVVLGALLADDYLRREDLDGPEFYALMMLSASGAMFMAAANDLIVLFLGLELLSISLYVMAGLHLRRSESQEAAMKYFLLGAFSSAFFLYGIALVYGATGSTALPAIADFLRTNVLVSNGLLVGGLGFLLVGLGFKVAAVPFHMWTPDVYQGAPTPVTGFMAAAAKAAGFAGLLRVLFSTFITYRLDWQPVVWALAVATLVLGSVVALVQTDVKRMLAYSSIAHAGYVLVGVEVATSRGTAGALFYLLAYTFMVLGSFGVVTVVGRRGDAAHDLDTYRGLASRRPALALAFTIFLLAQAGVPPSTGFLAKFYVIGAAVEARAYALAIIAMVAAVVAAFFYLRVIVVMYMTASEEAESPRLRVPAGVTVALAATLGFTLVFGIVPGTVFDFARHATVLRF